MVKIGYYILDGKSVVEVDLLTWARWYEDADRTVGRTRISEGVRVSTVFLGYDLGFDCSGSEPLLFETRIFGGERDDEKHRYSTWDQAEDGHHRVVASFTPQ